MKVLLDIKEEKVGFVLELLRSFKFVKARPLTSQSAMILEDLKEAVEEVNQVKEGKKKSKSLTAFLDEI